MLPILCFIAFITIICSTPNYTAKYTRSQLFILQSVNINSTDGSCKPKIVSTDACAQYCKNIFDYNPNYMYNNARYFNTTTNKCQPQQICDLTIYVIYNSTTNTCYNLYYGSVQPSKNASLPADYATYPEWTLFCFKGIIVVDQHNINSCKCNFGWESSWGYNSYNQVSLCDSGISILRYLTHADKPYYMLSSDVNLPLYAQSGYIFKSLRYFFRLIKFHIGNYFQPYAISIATVFMNRDQFIMEEDYPYIIVPCVLLLIIIIFTIRFKCKQVMEQEEMQQLSNNHNRNKHNQFVGTDIIGEGVEPSGDQLRL